MEEIIKQIMEEACKFEPITPTNLYNSIALHCLSNPQKKFWIESTIKILEGLKKENIYERSGDDIAHGENIQIDLLNYVLDDAIQLLKTYIP